MSDYYEMRDGDILCESCARAADDIVWQDGDPFCGTVHKLHHAGEEYNDDGRGFKLMVVWYRGEVTFVAGCRRFTYERAIAHWSNRQRNASRTDDRLAARRLMIAVVKLRNHLPEDHEGVLDSVDHEGTDIQECSNCHTIVGHLHTDCLVCAQGITSGDEGVQFEWSDYDDSGVLVCKECADRLDTVFGAESTEHWLYWRGRWDAQHERAQALGRTTWTFRDDDRRRSFGVWFHYIERFERERKQYDVTLLDLMAGAA